MFLQSLTRYADTYLVRELNDAAWEKKPVPWLLEISKQGTFLAAVPHMTSVTRGTKQVQVPQGMVVPHSPVNRNSGHYPLLSVDNIAYVLGAGPWTPAKSSDKEKAEKHNDAFVALITKAAEETGDAALQSCKLFYANHQEVMLAREALKNAKAGSVVALSVGGALVHHKAVQSFWNNHYHAAFSVRMEGAIGECIITGKTGAIAPTHEKIKGISSLGGQASGVALMSFDKEAFCSYGWKQNQNGPLSPERAMAYVLALNDLLRFDMGKRKDIAGVGFFFWLRQPATFNPFEALEPLDTASKIMFKLDPRVEPDSNKLYLAGVSGNGGRLRLRYWVSDSLPRIKENLRQWHEQLRIYYPWGDPVPVRFWQLEYAIHREGKPPAHHTIALLRRAIEGSAQPLGYSILSMALTRLSHSGGRDSKARETPGNGDPMSLQRLRISMALIRLCINDIHCQRGVTEMSEGLDTNCAVPAYVCGRLMAEFENLQRASSNGEINSSVSDRYFALASTYPSVAFPRIESLAQNHLRKLRRNKVRAAYANAIDTRLQELHNKLQPTAAGAYPSKLSLEGQGLFVLGYYHQKAWSISQARGKQSNESGIQGSDQESEQ